MSHNLYKPAALHSIREEDGKKYAHRATAIGALSLFLVGMVTGTIAILYAIKAKRRGVEARTGFLLGIIGIITGIFWTFILSLLLLDMADPGPLYF